jgi:hypothetical protein
MSAAIYYLGRKFLANVDVGIAYIYFTFSRQNQQTIEYVLESSVKQLSQRQDILPRSVQEIYDYHKKHGTRPTRHELSSLLHSVMSGYEHMFFVIDALDECTKSWQIDVLQELFGHQEKHGINILVTSRVDGRIAAKFASALELHISARKEDMRVYLNRQIERFDLETFDNSFRDMIVSEIVESAEGM